jgi:eukaryotic-like serine/threonine-protein kinase
MEHDPSANHRPAGQDESGALPAPEAAPLPVAIPDHQLLRRIGRGSYGAVWLARHSLGMYRAVKVVHRATFKDARPFERELAGIRKFEPLSRSHEGFVDVLHVGINEAEGYFYYVMELGDDDRTGQDIDPSRYSPKTLAKEIQSQRKLPVQETLRLGLGVSLALAELHRHNLVHRDIKPSNIIFVGQVLV